MAAAQQSGLISQLVKAVPGPAQGSRLAKRREPCRQQLLLTLFFLGAVGLARPWDLRHYSGDGLALLTGRRWAYGYVHTDRFLGELARSQADQRLSAVVAQWSYQLWGRQAPYYIDMHRTATNRCRAVSLAARAKCWAVARWACSTMGRAIPCSPRRPVAIVT